MTQKIIGLLLILLVIAELYAVLLLDGKLQAAQIGEQNAKAKVVKVHEYVSSIMQDKQIRAIVCAR